MNIKQVVLLLALASGIPGAATATSLFYSNTMFDTGLTVLFSTEGYNQIGDELHMVSGGNAKTAAAQFFNFGTGGQFDAVLRFYQLGAPVGAQIGSAFRTLHVASVGNDTIDTVFVIGGLVLPQDVIFTLAFENATAGMDLGVNLFDPPTVGSSNFSNIVVENAVGLSVVASSDNVYFSVSGDPISGIPEPGTWLMMVGGLVIVSRKMRRA